MSLEHVLLEVGHFPCARGFTPQNWRLPDEHFGGAEQSLRRERSTTTATGGTEHFSTWPYKAREGAPGPDYEHFGLDEDVSGDSDGESRTVGGGKVCIQAGEATPGQHDGT